MTSQIPSSFESTSTDLLSRVQAHSPEAWQRLVALYGPLVYGWCRRSGLQQDDAADVVQEVFRAVLRAVGQFQRGAGSSFRGWLWTITRNQIRLHFRRRALRPRADGGTDAQQQLQQVPELLESEDEPDGAVSRKQLAQRALKLVRNDFEESTWQAFWRMVIEGQSATEIAADLGLQPAAVRQAKYRVLCRLREELG